MNGGKLALEGDFGSPPEGQGGQWPPFRPFGDLYYTYQLSLDLKVEEGWAIRTEPHPRFYTDPTDTTPIAVPALIRRWWPMIFFLVFKSPPEGKTHIFRPREPFVERAVALDLALGRRRDGGEIDAHEADLALQSAHDVLDVVGAAACLACEAANVGGDGGERDASGE